MDLLLSVRPTVCGSFASLPFRDASFDAVWWDPPHLIRNDTKNWNPLYARFGNYRNRREFEDLWIMAGVEFARVLRDSGELVVKYIYGRDRRVPNRDDICLLPLFREVERVERPSTVGWSTNTTAFVRMAVA